MDIHSHIYLLINDTAQTIVLNSTFVWFGEKTNNILWCGLYHLLVGICENGYPLAHIPTDGDKWYMVYTIALYSTNNCDVVPSSNLHDVHLPQKSPTV